MSNKNLCITRGKVENKFNKLLKLSAERNRQMLVLGTVLFFAGVMSIATIKVSSAATTGDTNVAQNVTAGALSITVAKAEMAFNDGSIGQTTVANTGTTAANAITISDLTASGNGWTVTGYFNTNFTKLTDSNIQMAIDSDMSWFPSAMTVTNNTGNNAQVTKGANGAFAGIASGNAKTLANAGTGDGAGSVDLYSLGFNYTIPMTATANDYKTNLRLTITN